MPIGHCHDFSWYMRLSSKYKYMRRAYFLVMSIFLTSILPGVSSAAVSCPNGTIRGGVCFPGGTGLPSPSNGIAGVLAGFMNWLLLIFSTIGIIAFVISGIQYLTAAGDESQAETAKKNMKFAMIGVLVGLSAYLIIDAIRCMLVGPGAGPVSFAC